MLARSEQRRLAVIGAPIEDGVGWPGTSLGPAALRAAGLTDVLQRNYLEIRDLGDLEPTGSGSDAIPDRELDLGGPAHRAAAVRRWTRALSDATLAAARRGEIPVVLGGDHALSIGSMHGAARHWAEQRRELYVLWLDAHADINTPLTTPSGNIHGMVLAALTGEPMLAPLFGGANSVPIDPRKVLMLGVRSIDPGEAEPLTWGGYRVAGKPRMLPALGAFIDRVAARGGALHVSFDVDVLDPSLAPGVGTPVAGGLGISDLLDIMQIVRRSGLVTSLDIVEVNPLHDSSARTARIAAGIAASAFAEPAAALVDNQFSAARMEQSDERVFG